MDMEVFNELVPDGIAKFEPRCCVCTKLVPKKRAGQRQFMTTCSAECSSVMKALNTYNRKSRFCNVCRHPSTPAERASYLEWRRQHGNGRGRPPVKRVALLEATLREAVQALRDVSAPELADRFQKVIDAKGQAGGTLAASGEPTALIAPSEGEE